MAPIRRTELNATVSPKSVARCLQESIRFRSNLLRASFDLTGWGSELTGTWGRDSFWIMKNSFWTVAYYPFGKARILPSETGSVIEILFFAPYSLILFATCVVLYFTSARYPEIQILTIWFWGAMHLVGILTFNWQASKIERAIEQILSKSS